MSDITQRLADALRAVRNEDMDGSEPAIAELLAAYDATQNGGCKPYKDSVFYVVATWRGERQIWREGFFDSAEDAATAFDRYAKDFIEESPNTPAFNPEIRELEV